MFTDYVLDVTFAKYQNRILIIDDEDLDGSMHYSAGFEDLGFDVIHYKDDLSFRIEKGDEILNTSIKMLIIADSKSYIPYDILREFRTYGLSYDNLFPKLNTRTLKENNTLNLDLLSIAYSNNYDDYSFPQQTENFLREKVNSKTNVAYYLKLRLATIMDSVDNAENYRDWIKIAEAKAQFDVMAAEFHIDIDTVEINRAFKDFALEQFGRLSTELDSDTPVLVSHVMEYMHDHSDKFILIVMDGMSEFDWEILSKSFNGINYERSGVLAMIPSTTSVSRQCLLSNKYPRKLIEPWKQSKEKQEFVNCAKKMGYSDNQIGYGRGYDADFRSFVRCAAVIINDVDDLVHAQHQGRQGMKNDIKLLASQGKLAQMTNKFLANGYDVYITSDHGNTPCVGIGPEKNTGVDVKTKGKRMIVLQNFADKSYLQEKYGLIDYPKYYLNKDFDYLICDVGDSLDIKGEEVMTHGGISIDEVVVPFIKVKVVNVNG